MIPLTEEERRAWDLFCASSFRASAEDAAKEADDKLEERRKRFPAVPTVPIATCAICGAGPLLGGRCTNFFCVRSVTK